VEEHIAGIVCSGPTGVPGDADDGGDVDDAALHGLLLAHHLGALLAAHEHAGREGRTDHACHIIFTIVNPLFFS
jgi:hypothetical protein